MTNREQGAGTGDSPAQGIPAELLLRRDRSIRYERGGKVYATDGLVGTLRHLVVDVASGTVTALAVTPVAASQAVLLPPDLVDKTAGTAVFLTLSRAQFDARAPHAPVYDKRHYVKAKAKAVLGRGRAAPSAHSRRTVIRAGRDFVETPPVTAEQPETGWAIRAA